MIISVKQHIGSIGDLDLDTVRRVGMLAHFLRRGMAERLGLKRVHMYQEEYQGSHFHLWLLPLWPDVLKRAAMDPRIHESNVTEYLDLFSFQAEKERIERCRSELADYLRRQPELMEEGLCDGT
jgi:hypothetical protein